MMALEESNEVYKLGINSKRSEAADWLGRLELLNVSARGAPHFHITTQIYMRI